MLPTKPIPTCIWKYENTDILSNSNSFANKKMHITFRTTYFGL